MLLLLAEVRSSFADKKRFQLLYAFVSTKNLLKYLRLRYNDQTVQDLNYQIKLKSKVVWYKKSGVFLRKCLDNHVTPSDIEERVSKTKPKCPYGIERAFIKDEMKKMEDLLEHVSEACSWKLLAACKELSLLNQLRFCNLLNLTTERLRQQIKMKDDKTLCWLLQSQIGIGVLRDSTIVNLVNIELSQVKKEVLCRG